LDGTYIKNKDNGEKEESSKNPSNIWLYISESIGCAGSALVASFQNHGKEENELKVNHNILYLV
jgi:hypothetical protein